MVTIYRRLFANEVNLGQEFILSPGQSSIIAGEGLTIKFIEVISEGRCPKGAICIWAGEASILTKITTHSESTHRKVLVQPGLAGASKTSFASYKITLDLQPYPEAGKAPVKNNFQLHLVISKKPAPGKSPVSTSDEAEYRETQG